MGPNKSLDTALLSCGLIVELSNVQVHINNIIENIRTTLREKNTEKLIAVYLNNY